MSEAAKVAVLARIPAQPGKRDELVAALQAAIDNANTEDDTRLYILHTNDADPDAVLFYELYTNEGLIRSAAEAAVGAGGNVYAELGSTWRTVMGGPDEAAHVLGKLLVAFGPERILWGTDSIWYGSPQDQIAAFRAFEISTAFQEQYGYPALTPAVKQRILGANAVDLFGIVAPMSPCPPVEGFRSANRTLGPVSRRDVAATFLREHPWIAAAVR